MNWGAEPQNFMPWVGGGGKNPQNPLKLSGVPPDFNRTPKPNLGQGNPKLADFGVGDPKTSSFRGIFPKSWFGVRGPQILLFRGSGTSQNLMIWGKEHPKIPLF